MSYFVFDHKRMYYHESGTGKPLLFLHGNTASSNMYAQIAEKYKEGHRVILIDFLGHGKSDRLHEFPVDLWFYEAQQVIAFLKGKQYTDVSIIGSSGGALVAINVALEAPELVGRVIADSFEGETPHKAFTENLLVDRARAKSDQNARAFYVYMHGPDWEEIVDHDTSAIIRHEKEIGCFYHKPLHALKADILLTGSKKDEFMSAVSEHYLENTYRDMLRWIGHGRIHLFDSGGHPAMITNQDEFFRISTDFLCAPNNAGQSAKLSIND
ncbi:MAG: alpha/beta hydrolase [Clostridiales bacterium]|nr:alpha/beta hydrolase [Clostridiales bacterium]